MRDILRHSLSALLLFDILGASSAAEGSTGSETISSSASETHRVAQATVNNIDLSDEIRQRGGWYAGLHVGAALQPDLEIRGAGLKIDVQNDIGYIFDLVIGYKLPLGLRLETEFSYRNNDTNAIYSHTGNINLGNGIGGVEAASALVNAWYDFDFIFKDWYPYAGGGLGYSKLWINPGHSFVTTSIDSSDSSMVGQIGVGMVYRYTRDLEISLDYRYLRSVLEFKFYDEPRYPGANDATYQTHSFMLGFRGFF